VTGGRIRVMLCDDSTSLATLVDAWLDGHDDLEFVGAVHEVRDCPAGVAAARPDVVLLDTMGDPRDSTALDAIRVAAPAARVILYSGYVGLLGAEGIPLEADAFVDKGVAGSALVAAIRSVAAGG
jgi:DNA-binding NarL/FixJ family response regulator